MSESNEALAAAETGAHEPHIKVLKGQPTDFEVAALVGVLSAAGGGPVEQAPIEVNMWGHPVDKLRYQPHSFELVTLQARTHLRR